MYNEYQLPFPHATASMYTHSPVELECLILTATTERIASQHALAAAGSRPE